MQLGRIVDIALAIVVVGGVVAVVRSPNTQGDIKAVTDGFSGSLNAALGSK